MVSLRCPKQGSLNSDKHTTPEHTTYHFSRFRALALVESLLILHSHLTRRNNPSRGSRHFPFQPPPKRNLTRNWPVASETRKKHEHAPKNCLGPPVVPFCRFFFGGAFPYYQSSRRSRLAEVSKHNNYSYLSLSSLDSVFSSSSFSVFLFFIRHSLFLSVLSSPPFFLSFFLSFSLSLFLSFSLSLFLSFSLGGWCWWVVGGGWWVVGGGWWLVGGGWWLVVGGWWVVGGGWWVVGGRWWVVVGGWWLVGGGWWLLSNKQQKN